VDLDGLKKLLTQPMLLQQEAEGKIVVSSGFRALINSLTAKRHETSATIKASSIAGSVREYHFCCRWIRSMVATGYGSRPPYLLAMG
jgi:hypothetical protein